MINFGVGQLVINPGGATPTPIQLAILQDVGLDLAFAEKLLYGAYQLPVDVARGEAKFAIKAKEAQVSSLMLGSFLAGSTSSANYTAGAINEAGTIPASPAYTVTVANSGTFVADSGIVDLTAGIVMTRVSSVSAAGQYSVSAGVYTFYSADASHSVWISYSYTVSGSGKTLHYNNQLMGQGVSYSAYLFNVYRTKVMGFKLYAVTWPKLSAALKNNDFTVTDNDLNVYADSMGNVLEYYESDF